MKNQKRLWQAMGIVLVVNMGTIAATETQIGSKKIEKEAETIYGIGSVSKVFTSAAIMQLVEKGKVDLDEPITTYLSEFHMADERYKNITVRMLLNHSSGLMGTTFSNSVLYDDNDTSAHDNLIQKLTTKRLKADPGLYSTYCNDGFEMATLIVERISGKSFTEYLQENIFNPLDMKSSGTPVNKLNDKMQVTTYFNNETVYAADYCSLIGSGGILSTAEDLSKFGTAFFTGQNSLLSDASLNEMRIPVTSQTSYGYIGEGSADQYGLGWDSIEAYPFNEYGITALVKGGDVFQQHGMLMVLPDEDVSVAVVSSGGSSIFNELLAQELATIALEEKGIELSESKSRQDEPTILDEVPESYLKYAGTYANNMNMYRISFPDKKCLKIETCDTEIPRTQYYHYADNGTFIAKDYGYINSDGMTNPSLKESGETALSFMTETDGKEFLCMDTTLKYAEIGESKLSGMLAQKIEPVTLEDSVLQAWETRNGKKYYLVSEKYSSGFWMVDPVIKVELSTQIPGYINASGNMCNSKIVSSNEAKAYITLTGGAGRDLNDVSIIQDKGGELLYLQNADRSYIEETQIPDLDLSHPTFELQHTGAKWYSIGEETKGEVVTLELSDKMSVYIYNQYDECIYSSYMKNRGNKVILPEGGKMAVIGEVGSVLTIEKD